MRYICIHGHFYQPPRENPWLESVELEDTAYPYHDWNERITAECYAPNTASRILNPYGFIVDIINNYSKISFNFGPTLLIWLKENKPEVYKKILEADRLSAKRFSGHGSAIAQAYNHIILPLANTQDKKTQIYWGIRDFTSRFERYPEGMWLPETAVDYETLEILAKYGIKFTILAPHQAKRVKKIESKDWIEVNEKNIDTTKSYLCKLPSGRNINIFFYNGKVSHKVAFGRLLVNGETFAKELIFNLKNDKTIPQIVNIATDGETYGHYYRFGDMALSYCLYYIETNHLAEITNYAEYLMKYPPIYEVEIRENTSWSCIHGVERWKNDCGCNTGKHPQWNQSWRKPLREAMDWLRDQLISIYEEKASKYFADPWKVKNEYIEVILDRSRTEKFFKTYAIKELSLEEKREALKLLEMQRNALLMYTSCGWYFDDISGIESIQIMKYAARAVQLAEEITGISLEEKYLDILKDALSNIPKFENGAKVYKLFVKPSIVKLQKVGVHYAISSLFRDYTPKTQIFCYTIEKKMYEKFEAGKFGLAIGRVKITSNITLDEEIVDFAALHFGDHNSCVGVSSYKDDQIFQNMFLEIKNAFETGDMTETLKTINKYFSPEIYTLRHLFKDEQRKILKQALKFVIKEIKNIFRDIYEEQYNIMNFLRTLDVPLPAPMFVVAELVVNEELKAMFKKEKINIENLEKLVKDAKRWKIRLQKEGIEFHATSFLEKRAEELYNKPEDLQNMQDLIAILDLLKEISIEPNLWKIQNECFYIAKKIFKIAEKEAKSGNEKYQKWLEKFLELCKVLKIKIITS